MTISLGMFADLTNDWRVHVVEADVHHAGIFYVGSYPYDQDGRPLHPDAPRIGETWDGSAPGARQISQRQKLHDRVATPFHYEPVFERMHA